MRFLPFLKRSDQSRRSRRRVAPPPDLASVEQLRTRTRRRLIGAAVLVTGAVVLLPMALESTPRPPSTPVTIDMPARPGAGGPAAEALAPKAAPVRPGEAPASGTASALAAKPGNSPVSAPMASPAPTAVAPRPAPQPEATAPRKLAAAAPSVSQPVARPPAERKTAEAEKAKATAGRGDKPAPARPAADKSTADKPTADKPASTERKESRPEAKATAAKKPAESRVFIQVGAYAEASTVKSVRQRVDKLGMKSHEQTVETASGQRTRVRLGPFASREEADGAAAKLRAGGLGATVVAP